MSTITTLSPIIEWFLLKTSKQCIDSRTSKVKIGKQLAIIVGGIPVFVNDLRSAIESIPVSYTHL